MSTYYYSLSWPISSVHVEDAGNHERVTIWMEGQNVGTLTFTKDRGETSSFLRMISNDRFEDHVMRTYSLGFEEVPGFPERLGKSKGYGLQREQLSRTRQVVDEYGDLHWISDVVMNASRIDQGLSTEPKDWLENPANADNWRVPHEE